MKFNSIKLLLLFLTVLFIGQNAVAQDSSENLFSVSEKQIKEYIEEVYQHEASMVFDSPQRMRDIQDLLKNRFVVVPITEELRPKLGGAEELTTLSLNTSNNPNLKKEKIFDPQNFNPLKYNFNFYPIGAKLYRVGEKYIIVIKPQQRTVSY